MEIRGKRDEDPERWMVMNCFKNRNRKSLTSCFCMLAAALLACVMAAGCLVQPVSAEEEATRIRGQWDRNLVDLGEARGFPLVLDTPLYECTKLKIGLDVRLNYGARCEYWGVYASDSTGWEHLGDIYMPEGNGKLDTVLQWEEPKTIQSVIVAAKVRGSYSGCIMVYVYAFNDGSSLTETEAEQKLTRLEGKVDTKLTHVGYSKGYAYQLEQPVKDCEKLRVKVNMALKYSAHCNDWTVFAGNNGKYTKVAELYLPSGTGRGQVELQLEKPMDIDSILIVPNRGGAFSWDMEAAVYQYN